MVYMGSDPCAKCEEMLQPFLDRELSEDEYAIAEAHLDECGYCRKRYKFEETPPELKQKLAALRTPL
jgi:predicted anti-sigma-YlaC factor YlaD